MANFGRNDCEGLAFDHLQQNPRSPAPGAICHGAHSTTGPWPRQLARPRAQHACSLTQTTDLLQMNNLLQHILMPCSCAMSAWQF
jgi:hypothetical protein